MTDESYPRPQLAADVVAVAGPGPDAVLLVERRNPPFEGEWALPGGFVEERERTRDAAARELAEETGLAAGALELVGVYDDPDRDPRGWIVSITYLARFDAQEPVAGADDAADARWWPVDALPGLAFDHDAVIADAVAATRPRPG